jgi:DNA mismatch repair protein MutS
MATLMENSTADTPMMKQYRRIKSQLPPGTILFFRLGDFYEMFYEDAQTASGILDITLTKRQHVPMCGVPYHAADQYLARLVRAGLRVAVCDQLEDPAGVKGIVRRDVTSIVTPGTVTGDGVLESSRNNYLAGVHLAGGVFGLALLDLSTGAFQVEEATSPEALRESLKRAAPSECVVPAEQYSAASLSRIFDGLSQMLVTTCEDWTFDAGTARDLLIRHFAVQSLDGFGCEGRPALVGAAGGVLHYVKEQLHRSVSHVRSIRVVNPGEFLVLDEVTRLNLDLVSDRGRNGEVSQTSLLKVLDCTRTAMGSRLLRNCILRPLANAAGIRARHDAVQAFCADRGMLHKLRATLENVKDVERLTTRLGAGSGNARDLKAMAQSLASLPAVKNAVGNTGAALVSELSGRVCLMPDLVGLIERAIADEPPVAVTEGGLIRRGYNDELDKLRDAAADGRKWLAEFQARERERTGIRTLKVCHNRVFGYYIEVSKGQLENVPPEYTRKQTLVNAERFVTPEIKEYEQRILGAQERAVALEYDLFVSIREAVVCETGRIQETAVALAWLDVLASFADRALASGYLRPEINDGDRIEIRDGRHPVVEQIPDAERFVPNDILLDRAANQLLLITGPNMAGKSTYIRQAALIVIMAQAGSFVPASAATIGVVDRVFTRIGASDDLSRGRSTFMVEMQETANILNNATCRSLIVLDEIGRGTSTFDGISIAWAVAEFLHGNQRVKAKTLFATHYHELTDLALTLPGVKNYSILVREKGDGIVFLRKIVPGAADKSYGIHVAKLAGLPAEVVDRAKEILQNLEEGEFSEAGKPKLARTRTTRSDPSQMTLL